LGSGAGKGCYIPTATKSDKAYILNTDEATTILYDNGIYKKKRVGELNASGIKALNMSGTHSVK